jgi:hypothetical protein
MGTKQTALEKAVSEARGWQIDHQVNGGQEATKDYPNGRFAIVRRHPKGMYIAQVYSWSGVSTADELDEFVRSAADALALCDTAGVDE